MALGINNIHLLLIFVYFGIVEISTLNPGECSNNCQTQQLFGNETAACYCSPACAKFGDCCFNSPFRKADLNVKMPTVCIPLENKLYSAIGSCPPKWRSSSHSCLENNGHLLPVTSLSSGATYTNIYCAICNGDSFNVTIWDVKLQCCPNPKFLQSGGRKKTKVLFYFRGYAFWRWTESREGRFTYADKCQCTFKSRNGKSFVPKTTELRQCQTGVLHLHSGCALHWRDKKIAQYCASYFDPVYVYDRVYRNIHCAVCNYDDISKARCVPGVVTFMKKHNISLKKMREYCKTYHINSCLHYMSSPKGSGYAFSEIFATSTKKCIPQPGSKRRCCENERYDYMSKMCKPVTS